jgi:hypothetical protein
VKKVKNKKLTTMYGTARNTVPATFCRKNQRHFVEAILAGFPLRAKKIVILATPRCQRFPAPTIFVCRMPGSLFFIFGVFDKKNAKAARKASNGGAGRY